jgi:hypothetical protein
MVLYSDRKTEAVLRHRVLGRDGPLSIITDSTVIFLRKIYDHDVGVLTYSFCNGRGGEAGSTGCV